MARSLRGKQTFSHDEKSSQKSQRLAKVHLRILTQPALYPVASYHPRESVAVWAIQPCSHTIIQLCELVLGWWPDVAVSVIILMSLLPLIHKVLQLPVQNCQSSKSEEVIYF